MRAETAKTRVRASLDPQATAAAAALMRTTLPNALMELLQNARRAGAECIHIETDEHALRVCDDGHGITDPSALLTFGRAEWNPRVAENERPAGIGLYCLTDRPAHIESRTIEGRRSTDAAWSVTLHPKHFEGTEAARIERCESAPMPHGTRVSILADTVKRWVLEHLVRHFPLPVYIDGDHVPQHRFIDKSKALKVYTWRGLRIGIYAGTNEENESQLSFHGAISHLPITTVRRAPWARVEVLPDQPNGLLFERPGYAGLLENTAYNDLIEEIENRIGEAR